MNRTAIILTAIIATATAGFIGGVYMEHKANIGSLEERIEIERDYCKTKIQNALVAEKFKQAKKSTI